MHIEVRLAEKEDLGKLHDIINEIHECDIGLRNGRLEEALDSGLSSYLMATCEGEAVGFINLWSVPDIVDGDFIGIILDCYVLGEYRGRGIGEMLVESAMDMGKSREINKYFSWVDPKNEPAIALLHKFGFKSGSLMLEKKR